MELVHGGESVEALGDFADGGDSEAIELFPHAVPDRRHQLVPGQLRERKEVVHLLDHPGRLTIVVPDDGRQPRDAVVHLLVVRVDAGELERPAVEHTDVPACAQRDRDIGADAVQLLAGRQALLRQLLVEEEVGLADEPTVSGGPQVGPQLVQDGRDRPAPRSAAVHRLVLQPCRDFHVRVHVHESWGERSTAQVANLGVRSNEGCRLLASADAADHAVQDGDEARRHRRVVRQPEDLVGEKDKVGRVFT